MSPEAGKYWRLLTVTVGGGLLAALSILLVKLVRQDLVPLISSQEFGSSFGILLLININIIVLVVLGFLVLKNIFKLFLDRRKNVLGSRLRSRLVAAFFLIALVPTGLLFIVAKGIVDSVLQDWFAPQVSRAVESSKEVLELYYDEKVSDLEQDTLAIVDTLQQTANMYSEVDIRTGNLQFDLPRLNRYIEELRDSYVLDEVSLYSLADGYVAGAGYSEPNLDRLRRSYLGESVVGPEQSLDSEVLRAYFPIGLQGKVVLSAEVTSVKLDSGEPQAYALVVGSGISGEVAETLSAAIAAHDEYRELTTYRKPVASTYLLTLLIVTLMVVFGAIWIGFYIAKTITGPILQLVDGTRAVATGRLEHRIPEVGDDEISFLVRSFNAMAADLHASTSENVARRKYMEAVLNHVEIGVVAIDKSGRVTTSNPAAQEILDFDCYSSPVGLLFTNILPKPLRSQLESLIARLKRGHSPISRTIVLGKGDESRHLKLTLSTFSGGAVIIVDDMSAVISAQRMAAWREVAQRIAHEIKNPLTPIQLTAQRIERRSMVEGSEALRSLIKEGTDTIVSQVQVLRELVSEFSKFARLPQANPVPTDINSLVKEVVSLYKDSHPKVNFETKLDETIVPFAVDPDQIRRVILNLIENAVSAVEAYQEEYGLVSIKTSFQEEINYVSLEVSDTGPGVATDDYSRIFEPYYSTKQRGTGLGLAIVNAIVSDHGGVISVKPAHPHGACFTVELPFNLEAKTANS